MGGAGQKKVKQLIADGADLIPVTIDAANNFVKLLEIEDFKNLNDPNLPEGWTNFFRSDDVSATAYFYLDSPVSELSGLPPIEDRITDLN
jgi:hypothetical protein